jgi:hypothetical protein
MLELMGDLEGLQYLPSAANMARSLAVAKAGGVSKEKLLPWLRAADALNARMKKQGRILYLGELSNAIVAVNHDLPALVEGELLKLDKIVSTEHLATALNKPKQATRNALDLLYSTERAQKIAPETEAAGGQTMLWTHATKSVPVPKKNASFRVIDKLERPMTIQELEKLTGLGDSTLRPLLSRLEFAGAIHATKAPSRAGAKPGTRPMFYGRTEEAHGLVLRQRLAAHLLPEMNALLLGRRLKGTDPALRRMLDEIETRALIREEYNELPRLASGMVKSGHLKAMAARRGRTKDEIIRISIAPTIPLYGKPSIEYMEHVLLPALAKRNVYAVQYARDFMNANPRKFVRSTNPRLRRIAESSSATLDEQAGMYKRWEGLPKKMALNFWFANRPELERKGFLKQDVLDAAHDAHVKAVMAFQKGRGANYQTLGYRLIRNELLTRFTPSQNMSRPKQKIHSMNALMTDKEGKTEERGDIMPDKSAVMAPEAASDRVSPLKLALYDEVMGLKGIPKRHKEMFVLRAGLDGTDPMTLEEVGREFKVTRERVRQVEAKIMRRLRHPEHMRKLSQYKR